MQNIDLASAKAAKATERRALAILAYDNACADPATANWRGVADLLRLALPASKAKAAAETAESLAWADYDIPANTAKKLGKSPVLTVTFACGAVVRAPAVSLPGKPINLGRGLRIAFAYYRARIAREFGKAFAAGSDCVNVPEIVSAFSGEGSAAIDYDAAELNSKTAVWRRGSFDHVALAVSAEAYPVETDGEGMTRAEFWRLRYMAEKARAGLAEAVGEMAHDLAATIHDCELILSGMAALEVAARRAKIRGDEYRAAEAEAKAAARRGRVAAYLERRAARRAAKIAAPPPVEPSCNPPPVAADSPVAPAPGRPVVVPSRAARFLASSSLGAPFRAVPVAPSCAIRIAA